MTTATDVTYRLKVDSFCWSEYEFEFGTSSKLRPFKAGWEATVEETTREYVALRCGSMVVKVEPWRLKRDWELKGEQA